MVRHAGRLLRVATVVSLLAAVTTSSRAGTETTGMSGATPEAASAATKSSRPVAPAKKPLQGWLMRSYDWRRTGRARFNGPRKGDAVWRYVANDGMSINMEAAVTTDGVFFGTWGLIRKHGNDRTKWDKSDGKLYGLDPETGKELWPPLHPGVNPYVWKLPSGSSRARSRAPGQARRINWYNGTIEGTPAVDQAKGVVYFGRGDGGLYAVDYRRGELLWKFNTFDPAGGDDPETGGEVVGGPLLTTDDTIIFGTFATPTAPKSPLSQRHETNAAFAIDSAGRLLWRYPRRGTLMNPVVAPLALSPDGSRVYLTTNFFDRRYPAQVAALDRVTGEQLWTTALPSAGGQDLAVGADGTIYVAGLVTQGLMTAPAAMALKDLGNSGRIAWGPVRLDGPGTQSHVAGGLALMETGSRTDAVVISTTIIRHLNTPGGKLHVLDPATGRVRASWSPQQAQPPCVGGLTDVSLDADGVIYVGARGRHAAGRVPETRGRMYALERDADSFRVLWSLEADGQIDWASPAIGPGGGLYFGTTSRLKPLQQIHPRRPDEDVPDADPVFYGVRDSGTLDAKDGQG